MFYKNARIFTSDFKFHYGAFEVKDGVFGAVLPENIPEDAIDLQGATVIPGLVDVHTHGAMGEDFSDGKPEGMQPMADYYAAHGVTSFLATTMTLKEETLTPAMHVIRDFQRKGGAGDGAGHFGQQVDAADGCDGGQCFTTEAHGGDGA